MSWRKADVKIPIFDELIELAGALKSPELERALEIAIDAMEVAKVLYLAKVDPFKLIFSLLITELENFITDTFGSSLYMLPITPISINPVNPKLKKMLGDYGLLYGGASGVGEEFKETFNFKVESQKERGKNADDGVAVEQSEQTTAKKKAEDNNNLFEFKNGIPLLTPKTIIDIFSDSFDDKADLNRPQFSDNSKVACFGLMLTFPDVSGFVTLLDLLVKVFDVADFVEIRDEFKKKYNKELNIKDEEITPAPIGDPPNWSRTWRLDDIGAMNEAKNKMLEALAYIRGTLAAADEAVIALIDVIKRKLEKLEEIVEAINDLIDLLISALNASGVYHYWSNEDTGIKGLKESIRDFGQSWSSISSVQAVNVGDQVRFRTAPSSNSSLNGKMGTIIRIFGKVESSDNKELRDLHRINKGKVIVSVLDTSEEVEVNTRDSSTGVLEKSISLNAMEKNGYSGAIFLLAGGPSVTSLELIRDLTISAAQTFDEKGIVGDNEIKKITFSDIPDSGTWAVQFSYDSSEISFGDSETTVVKNTGESLGENTYLTRSIPFNAHNEHVKAALMKTRKIAGSADDASPIFSQLEVYGDYTNGFEVEFMGPDGKRDIPDFVVNAPGVNEIRRIIFINSNNESEPPNSGQFKLTLEGDTTDYIPFNATDEDVANALNSMDGGNNEKQKISYSKTPTEGGYYLSHTGLKTSLIPYDADASAIKAFLEAIPNIDEVTVTGDAISGFTIEFSGSGVSFKNHSPLVVIDNILSISTTSSGTKERQKITFVEQPVDGTFLLSYDGNATTPLAYNATNTDVKNALELLAGVGSLTVSGSVLAGFEIYFDDIAEKEQIESTSSLKTNELTVFTVPVGLNPVDIRSKYITIQNPTTKYYLWFEVDSVGTDPVIGGAIGKKISLASTDSIIQIASKINIFVNTDIGLSSEFISSLVNSQFKIMTLTAGSLPEHATEGDTDFGVLIEREGSDSVGINIETVLEGVDPVITVEDVGVSITTLLDGRPLSSGILVSGNFTTGFMVTFSEYWGGRPINSFSVSENSLESSSSIIGVLLNIETLGRKPINTLTSKGSPVDVTCVTQIEGSLI